MSKSWLPPGKRLVFLALYLALGILIPAFGQDAGAGSAPSPTAVAPAASDAASPATPPEPVKTGPGALALPPANPAPAQPAPAAEVKPPEVSQPPSTPQGTPAPSAPPATVNAEAEVSASASANASGSAAGTAQTAAPPDQSGSGQPAPSAEASGEDAAAAAAKEKVVFDTERLPILIIIVIVLTLVTYYTLGAQKGKEMFIRRISGLSAIDDAVGRATEMGKGILFIPGIYDMDDIQTVAGVTILGQVAKKTAEYDTPLFAPMARSFCMSVAQEVVKQSYIEKGRPDAFRADRINYLTDDQFGYVAGVGGIVMREKPAACFYMGVFFAESLILAETGNSVGAIQIAGTAEAHQIPFFVAACDYTLIGEELFAASAYLSRNPKEVGSLKGSDVCKIIIIAAILVGTVLITVSQTQWGQAIPALKRILDAYMGFLSI